MQGMEGEGNGEFHRIFLVERAQNSGGKWSEQEGVERIKSPGMKSAGQVGKTWCVRGGGEV